MSQLEVAAKEGIVYLTIDGQRICFTSEQCRSLEFALRDARVAAEGEPEFIAGEV